MDQQHQSASGRLATGRVRAVAELFEIALKWRDLIHLDTGLALSKWPAGDASPQLPRPADVVDNAELGTGARPHRRAVRRSLLTRADPGLPPLTTHL